MPDHDERAPHEPDDAAALAPPPENLVPRWRGVMPAITTPFRDEGSIDTAAVRARIDRAIEAGCTAIIPAGSLGEGNTLSPDEKRALFALCVEACEGRVPVVAAIAAAATDDAIALASEARAVGCGGLMVLPPYVHSGDAREVVAHLAAVLASTDLPCMLYNNPVAYGADLRAPEIVALAERFPQLRAVKESSGDVRRITALHALAADRLAVSVGLDDVVVEGVRAGAVGWVAGLVNAFPVASVRLFDGARDGDPGVDILYDWFLPLLRLDVVPDFVQRIKWVEERLGLGSARVRAPRLPLPASETAALEELLAAALATNPLTTPLSLSPRGEPSEGRTS